MDFDGQRPDEEVQFIFRRHIITIWRALVVCLFLVFVGFLPVLLWPDHSQMVFIWIIFVIFGLLSVVYAYILWYFSLYIVTDQRLRQIRQKGFFHKTVVDLELSKIANLSVASRGFLAGLFNYGTILIQTQAGDLIISNIRYPEKVYNELQNTLHKIEGGGKNA